MAVRREKMILGSLPLVEVYARLHSGIEWICPDCHKINRYRRVDYRAPTVSCMNQKCKHTFMVGIAMGLPEEIGPQPENCRVLPRIKQFRLMNKRGLPEGEQGWARMKGGLHWLCPACGSWVYDMPKWETAVVTCPICTTKQGCALILHHGNKGKRTGSPVDWTPPRGFYVESPEVALVVKEARKSGRATGTGDGDVSEAQEAGTEDY